MKKLKLILLICSLSISVFAQKNADTHFSVPDNLDIYIETYFDTLSEIKEKTITSLSIPAHYINFIDFDFDRLNKYFPDLDSIELIDFQDHPPFRSIDGVVYNGNTTELLYCPLKKRNLILPNSVKKINEYALKYDNALQTITLGDSAKVILHRCITFISWPLAILEFGELASIDVSSNNPFYTSIDGVLYSKDTTTLIYYPPAKKGKLIIPSSVKKIESIGLLSEIIVSDGNPVYSSEEGVIYNKNKTELKYFPRSKKGTFVLPKSVKIIPEKAFSSCSLKTVEFTSKSITEIPTSAFSTSKIESIILPSSVTEIGLRAFKDCNNLGEVTIPRSVTNIEPEAFAECYGLRELTVGWMKPLKINENIFEGQKLGNEYLSKELDLSRCTLRVPKGTSKAYKKAEIWKDFGHIVEIK